MGWLDYVWLGRLAVFQGPELFTLMGLPVSVTLVMILLGFLMGIAVGSTPGLAGRMAMAITLPILISIFGFSPDALLPVFGFLIGIMKGATIRGAVPAILFNTPGTPDADMTTLDGYPMTQKGQARKALRVAHFSSVSGDTFSDMVLIVCAPFPAVFMERYLDLPEKSALLILSLAFIASVIGGSVGKGLISLGLGLLAAYIGTGEDFYPRLSMDTQMLAQGFPIAAVVLGVLIVGEMFKSLEDLWHERQHTKPPREVSDAGDQKLHWADIRRLMPYVARSVLIGTVMGVCRASGPLLLPRLAMSRGRRVMPNPVKHRDLGQVPPKASPQRRLRTLRFRARTLFLC